MKNYSNWKLPHFTWGSINEFARGWAKTPGIHTIAMPEGYDLDILVNDYVAKSSPHNALLVFFGGAVTNRETMQGPFFSGVSVSNECELPLIAISDPSVDLREGLNLAWYTGGPKQNLQWNLEWLLRLVNKTTERELLLVGGSGGGFAALQYARALGDLASAFVWNPQTDIFEYGEIFVKIYLHEVFGIANINLDRLDWKDFYKGYIRQFIESSIVGSSTLSSPKRVLYLQNFSDWHNRGHLMPLLAETGNQHLSLDKGSHSVAPNAQVAIDDFESGHNPPSPELIKNIIRQMIDTRVHPSDVSLT